MKALFYSLSIDRGGVGAFLGCFAVASIINLSFLSWSHREGVQQCVVDSALGSNLGRKGEGLNIRVQIYIQWVLLPAKSLAFQD